MNGSDNITPSGQQSMTQPSPVLSALPSSPDYSSLPPLSHSPPSFRRNSLRSMSLSPSLLRDYPSDLEENREFSTMFKNIEPVGKHYRSFSMGNSFNDLLKLPPSPGSVSYTSSVDGDKNTLAREFGNEEYTADELKKISESTKLREVASDPKTVRRILANRASAKRSKLRQKQKIIDLAQRQENLLKEISSMDIKIKLLEEDKTLTMNEKREFMIRLESLEQLAKLRDETERLNGIGQVFVEAHQLKELITFNEHLRVELERLKMATGEVEQNHGQIDGSNMHQIEPSMFQQLTINEFNQPQTNPDDIYGQI